MVCLKTLKFSLSSIAFYIILLLLLFVGLFDQTGTYSIPNYDSVKNKFMNDEIFVSRIEQVLPRDSMVFQLPYIAYPESSHPYKMEDYDHLRFYLHTTKLRWSYGAVKGRSGDIWQKETASKPTADMIKEIAGKGFKGIFINRNGYKDNGDKIIQEIKNIVFVDPITSGDNTMVFFSLVR